MIGVELEFPRFDLSLERRRETDNGVVHEAAAAIREHGLGLKAATVTPEGRGDVGSPNRILREEIGGKVIVRTGRRIPGVVPLGGVHAPISIVRMAVGDAYGAKEWREGEGDDEVAFRTERIERRICHAVAEFAFRQAERTGAKVFGGPKYTVSPTYEGMLKEEMDAAAERHPEVPYEPQLIDATFALLLSSAGDPLVIPALNRDGDILSDLVLPLFGSIAGSESLLVAFESDFEPAAIMAEAAHGTAPSLQGKNVANPMAMILAGAALLSHAGEEAQRAGRAIREACLEAVAQGSRTADLGGHLGTTEFTDEVIGRVRAEARGLGESLGGECGALPGVPAVGPRLDEELSRDWVELRAGPFLHLGERVLVCERAAVGPRRDHRVEGVGDREDPGLDRDPAPAQPRRIAVAVPALVVEEDVRERVVEPPQRHDELRAGRRVAPDLRDLLERERSRLAEELRADLDLADVVQRRGPAKRANPLTIPAQPQRDGLGERRDAGAVAERVVALLECACDRGEHVRTDSAPARGLLPLPDASDRRSGAREAEPRQAPGVLDRPQQAVVVRGPREPRAPAHGRAERERLDAATASRVARPLVEDDEDDAAA